MLVRNVGHQGDDAPIGSDDGLLHDDELEFVVGGLERPLERTRNMVLPALQDGLPLPQSVLSQPE
jgi:hypothetical protein